MIHRAITLDGDLLRAIETRETKVQQEPAPAPAPKLNLTFTLAEAAHEFAEMGYDLVPSDRRAWADGRFPYGGPPTTHVEAELETYCGCKKQMFIPRHEIGRDIRTPVYPHSATSLEPCADDITVQVRRFVFWEMQHHPNGAMKAIYRERA